MELKFEVTKTGDNYDLVIGGTRYSVNLSIDQVLERISETLLEEEDKTPIPF